MLKHPSPIAPVLIAVLAGCAVGGGYGLIGPPGYEVTLIGDDFVDHTIHRMQGNRLPAPPSQGVMDFSVPYATELNAQRFDHPDVGTSYSLIFQLQGSGWLFIQEGESLRILADDERIVLRSPRGSTGQRDVIYGGTIRERAWYDVTPAQLRTIAEAEIVRLRVDGRQVFIERELSPANIENIARFVAEHVEPEGRAPISPDPGD